MREASLCYNSITTSANCSEETTAEKDVSDTAKQQDGQSKASTTTRADNYEIWAIRNSNCYSKSRNPAGPYTQRDRHSQRSAPFSDRGQPCDAENYEHASPTGCNSRSYRRAEYHSAYALSVPLVAFKNEDEWGVKFAAETSWDTIFTGLQT